MEKVFYYKIRDIEDDRYSCYLATSRQCKDVIEKAIEDWYDEDIEIANVDNVFDTIEQYLDMRDIEWKWIKFTNIDF